MTQLGPDSLNITSENEIKFLVDVKAAVIDPKVVPSVLGQMRLTRAQDDVA